MNKYDKQIKEIRRLCNSGNYKRSLKLTRKFQKQYPNEVVFLYYEAVAIGDDDIGLTTKQIIGLHKKAAHLLKPLLERLNEVPLSQRYLIKNEYFWFSHQPKKQYRLGQQGVAGGNKRSYYSQGVGAVEVAIRYTNLNKLKLSLRWAKKAERAWLDFFKVDAKWYNSYCWYAKSLFLQGKAEQAELALRKAAKISGKKIDDPEFSEVRLMQHRV